MPEFLLECGGAALLDLAKEFDVEVFETPAGIEADTAIVSYCRDNKNKVAAILAEDNDFLLMPHECTLMRMQYLNWAQVYLRRIEARALASHHGNTRCDSSLSYCVSPLGLRGFGGNTRCERLWREFPTSIYGTPCTHTYLRLAHVN